MGSQKQEGAFQTAEGRNFPNRQKHSKQEETFQTGRNIPNRKKLSVRVVARTVYSIYSQQITDNDSLVKLHYFQLTFLENCVYKKKKKSIKDQKNFYSNTFFKVFANSVSVVLILRYDVRASLTSRMI